VRLKALLLGQLGILSGRVGNHRIALKYLLAREKLPIRADEAGLALRLAEARALLHVGREAAAAAAAERALTMVEGTPALARYRPLALDRDALYHLAAGRFERALALYDAELPLLEDARGPGADRGRAVARLARAAAALGARQPGRALEDLAGVDGALAAPGAATVLQLPHASPEESLRAYRLIAAGLRANACRALGRLDEAQRALEERRALFLARLADRDRDEDVQALTLVEARLADVAGDRGDVPGAGAWLGHGLGHADALVARTHAPVDPGQLDVLLFAARFHVLGRGRIPFDLPARLREANERLTRLRDPAFRTYQRWYEIYETLATAPRDVPSAERR
jgi:tetratricopeptide (TPR) repeat protein